MNVFVVHHNPNSGRYRYGADPNDAIASAEAFLAAGEGRWVAGNCRKIIQPGDLLLFKFGGKKLLQAPGIYAAARVARAPEPNREGVWTLRYTTDVALSRRLCRDPIVGKDLERLVPRSFGSSIQLVQPRAQRFFAPLLGEAPPTITHGLLILKEPLDMILAGTKTWEIRGKATARRGPIALIQSKFGHIVGTCNLVGVEGPLTLGDLRKNVSRTGFRAARLPYATTYAWVVDGARRLAEPVPYRHPPGAVIWVKLEPSVIRRLREKC